MPTNLEISEVATGLEKFSFHSNPKEIECQRMSNYHTVALISHTSKFSSVALFQILEDDAVKVLCSICQQIWKTQQWTQDWKRSVFTPILKINNAKKCSNYHTIALISDTIRIMIKILKVRYQQYMNCEFPDFQAGFRKGRRSRDQIAKICWIIKKPREFQ